MSSMTAPMKYLNACARRGVQMMSETTAEVAQIQREIEAKEGRGLLWHGDVCNCKSLPDYCEI